MIVDEGSMIDLALMERLVRSLRDDCRFILLGDAHQLPSVEAGAVLRDLLTAGAAATNIGLRGVSLEHSYRMRHDDDDGRNILAVAQAIDRGEHPAFGPETDKRACHRRTSSSRRHHLSWSRVRRFVQKDRRFWMSFSIAGIVKFFGRARISTAWSSTIMHWLTAVSPQTTRLSCGVCSPTGSGFAFSASRGFCLPGPTASTWPFTSARWLNASANSVRGDDLIPGEPVMMQVNDYQRGIFNGDQGLVLNVSEGNQLQPMAIFPRSDGFAAFHIDSLRPVLLHSYAMTVHKAQGSEFDRVALILPDRDLPINTREILYTALTRSRVKRGDRR